MADAYKNASGIWECETFIERKDGKCLKILTMKRADGVVWSTSVFGVLEKIPGGGQIFTYAPAIPENDGKKYKHENIKKATKNTVEQAHEFAVSMFL